MITYKQLSLADIFTDCQNKFDNGKYEFLSILDDNSHKLIITQQLNIQCTFRCKHINHYIGVWSYIKIFKLSTPCC